VKLGKAKRETHVHKALLRSRSPYFNRIIKRHCGETTRLILNDVDVDTFFYFLSWLYTNSIPLLKTAEWLGLCRLWLLAERFEVRSGRTTSSSI
jgi:hypothetical protein